MTSMKRFFAASLFISAIIGCSDSTPSDTGDTKTPGGTDASFHYEVSCPHAVYPSKLNCADKTASICYGQYDKNDDDKTARIFSNHTPICSTAKIADATDKSCIELDSIANDTLKGLGFAPVHPEKTRWRTAECAFIAEKVRIAIAHQNDQTVKEKLWQTLLDGDNAASNSFVFGSRPGDLCNFAGRGADESNTPIPNFIDGYVKSKWGPLWDSLSEQVLRAVSENKFSRSGDAFWGDLAGLLSDSGTKNLAYRENNQPWGVGVSQNPQLGIGAGEGMNKQGRIIMMIRDQVTIKLAEKASLKGKWQMNWDKLDGGPAVPDENLAKKAKAFYPKIFEAEINAPKSQSIKLSAPGHFEIWTNQKITGAEKSSKSCDLRLIAP